MRTLSPYTEQSWYVGSPASAEAFAAACEAHAARDRGWMLIVHAQADTDYAPPEIPSHREAYARTIGALAEQGLTRVVMLLHLGCDDETDFYEELAWEHEMLRVVVDAGVLALRIERISLADGRTYGRVTISEWPFRLEGWRPLATATGYRAEAPGAQALAEPACGAQDWTFGETEDDIIVYGTCGRYAGHEGRHAEYRDGHLWAEWSGPADERAPTP